MEMTEPSPYRLATQICRQPGEQSSWMGRILRRTRLHRRDDVWMPGRWWTVLYADGRTYTSGPSKGEPQIWCQTSDEDEARDAVRTCPGGGQLFREYMREELVRGRTHKVTRLVEV